MRRFSGNQEGIRWGKKPHLEPFYSLNEKRLMKLGTRLTLYLSLVIIVVLTGYGYFHVDSHREVLTRRMKLEVRSISETLRVSLQKISLPREMAYIQELLDAISEPERTLGVLFCYRGKDIVFRSQSLHGEIGHFLELMKNSIREDRRL
jgi:hypothetical protein